MLLAAHVDLVESKGSKVQGFVRVRSRRAESLLHPLLAGH